MFAIGFISYCFLTEVFSSIHTEKEKNSNFKRKQLQNITRVGKILSMKALALFLLLFFLKTCVLLHCVRANSIFLKTDRQRTQAEKRPICVPFFDIITLPVTIFISIND